MQAGARCAGWPCVCVTKPGLWQDHLCGLGWTSRDHVRHWLHSSKLLLHGLLHQHSSRGACAQAIVRMSCFSASLLCRPVLRSCTRLRFTLCNILTHGTSSSEPQTFCLVTLMAGCARGRLFSPRFTNQRCTELGPCKVAGACNYFEVFYVWQASSCQGQAESLTHCIS